MKGKTVYTLIGVCLLTLTWKMPALGKMESPSYRVPKLTSVGRFAFE